MKGALPQGWEWTELSALSANEINSITDGPFGSKLKTEHYVEEGVRVIRLGNIGIGTFQNDVKAYITLEHFEQLKKHEIFDGDLIISALADPVGRCCELPPTIGKAIVKADCIRFKPSPHIERRLVLYWLNSPAGRKTVEEHSHGIGRLRVNLQNLRSVPIPLPPLAEQRRIVEKIEALLARARAAREALEAIPPLLARYRQSLLAAAFRGALTSEWRDGRSHGDARILVAEAEQAREMAWKFRRAYEPAATPTNDLPSLPDGWCWVSLDQLLTGIIAGKSFRCAERPPQPDEAGLIKISAVTWGRFNEDESKTVLDRDLVSTAPRIRSGDFLFSRANTIELVGACVLVEHVARELYLSDKVLRFDFAVNVKEWCLWFLRSPFGRQQIEENSSGNQMSMRNIGQESIRKIVVPLAPQAEMEAVLDQIRRASTTETLLAEAIQKHTDDLATLTQSILAKAFRGELVPQNPNDEPASVLLARIRAEREAAGKSKSARGRGRPRMSTPADRSLLSEVSS